MKMSLRKGEKKKEEKKNQSCLGAECLLKRKKTCVCVDLGHTHMQIYQSVSGSVKRISGMGGKECGCQHANERKRCRVAASDQEK